MALLSVFQVRYMCAVAALGDNARQERIANWLHARFGTIVDRETLEVVAEILLENELIKIVGSEEKRTDNTTQNVFEVTEDGIEAMRETLTFAKRQGKEKRILGKLRRRKMLH